jgi:hypothetical protein
VDRIHRPSTPGENAGVERTEKSTTSREER